MNIVVEMFCTLYLFDCVALVGSFLYYFVYKALIEFFLQVEKIFKLS